MWIGVLPSPPFLFLHFLSFSLFCFHYVLYLPNIFLWDPSSACGVQPQPKLNLVHHSHKIWIMAAKILVIFWFLQKNCSQSLRAFPLSAVILLVMTQKITRPAKIWSLNTCNHTYLEPNILKWEIYKHKNYTLQTVPSNDATWTVSELQISNL